MTKIIDAFKLAWVGFAEHMKWRYSVRLSNGTTMTRTKYGIAWDAPDDHSALFYHKPKWYQFSKRRMYKRLLQTDQNAFDDEANFHSTEMQE